MRKSVSIGAGAATAAVLTHGFVYAGMRLGSLNPPLLTYTGFFQNAMFAIWRLWSHAQGWEPLMTGRQLGHVEEFGRFFAHTVLFACPLLGLGVYRLLSRRNLGPQLWMPLILALAFPLDEVLRQGFRSTGLNEPFSEAARALVVFLLMLWSVEAIRIRKPSLPLKPQPHGI
jgi:hypothetical protein